MRADTSPCFQGMQSKESYTAGAWSLRKDVRCMLDELELLLLHGKDGINRFSRARGVTIVRQLSEIYASADSRLLTERQNRHIAEASHLRLRQVNHEQSSRKSTAASYRTCDTADLPPRFQYLFTENEALKKKVHKYKARLFAVERQLRHQEQTALNLELKNADLTRNSIKGANDTTSPQNTAATVGDQLHGREKRIRELETQLHLVSDLLDMVAGEGLNLTQSMDCTAASKVDKAEMQQALHRSSELMAASASMPGNAVRVPPASRLPGRSKKHTGARSRTVPNRANGTLQASPSTEVPDDPLGTTADSAALLRSSQLISQPQELREAVSKPFGRLPNYIGIYAQGSQDVALLKSLHSTATITAVRTFAPPPSVQDSGVYGDAAAPLPPPPQSQPKHQSHQKMGGAADGPVQQVVVQQVAMQSGAQGIMQSPRISRPCSRVTAVRPASTQAGQPLSLPAVTHFEHGAGPPSGLEDTRPPSGSVVALPRGPWGSTDGAHGRSSNGTGWGAAAGCAQEAAVDGACLSAEVALAPEGAGACNQVEAEAQGQVAGGEASDVPASMLVLVDETAGVGGADGSP